MFAVGLELTEESGDSVVSNVDLPCLKSHQMDYHTKSFLISLLTSHPMGMEARGMT
jgi:hypothetical protein